MNDMQEMIEAAAGALERGEVIVYPTETSYGLGADATNAEAVAKIFAIKGRPVGKGLPLIIPAGSASKYVDVNDAAQDLMHRFWPGALNIVLPAVQDSLVVSACAQDGFQSVRESAHPFAAALAEHFGKPITATSANVSGEDALYSLENIEQAFAGRDNEPDFIVDVGALEVAPASTTVKVDGGHVTILRQGAITL